MTKRGVEITPLLDKPYSAFWGCQRSCEAGGQGRSFTVYDDQWRLQQQMEQPKEGPDADPDDLPSE